MAANERLKNTVDLLNDEIGKSRVLSCSNLQPVLSGTGTEEVPVRACSAHSCHNWPHPRMDTLL